MTADVADAALVELVRCRSAALLRTAYLLTGHRAEAEDLLQEALYRVFRRRSRVRDLSVLEAYVRTTMVRAHIDAHRRLSSRELPVADPPESAGGAHPEDPAWTGEAWAAIRDLPARQRAVIVLVYYEDLSEHQVADVLGCSSGAVKSHRARALAVLRTRLGSSMEVIGGE